MNLPLSAISLHAPANNGETCDKGSGGESARGGGGEDGSD